MVINPERLREVAMGDEEFMVELIDLYLSDAPSQLQALDRAVASQDPTAILAAAHKLKGSCGNIGAEGLFGLCHRLEAVGAANRTQELPGLLRQVAREFGEVHAALHNIRADTHPVAQETKRESA
jgi:HPt (histidine-containing phosphotransfer) domain-containing protein